MMSEKTLQNTVFIIAALICIFALAKCDDSSPEFKQTRSVYSYQTSYYFLESRYDVEQLYKYTVSLSSTENTPKLLGSSFSFYLPNTNHCYIFTVDPGLYDRPKTEREFGHEHSHCIFGDYHKGTEYPNRFKPTDANILSKPQAEKIVDSLL